MQDRRIYTEYLPGAGILWDLDGKPDMISAEEFGKMIAIYLDKDISGFAIHLLQK